MAYAKNSKMLSRSQNHFGILYQNSFIYPAIAERSFPKFFVYIHEMKLTLMKSRSI
jgi:hypothetical protein